MTTTEHCPEVVQLMQVDRKALPQILVVKVSLNTKQ